MYHSGTVGACLTARIGGISGVAVSQAVTGFGVEGQGWDEMIADQNWESAAAVADVVVGALVADMPAEPVVVNVNVPNLPARPDRWLGRGRSGPRPARAVSTALLEPIVGHEDAFNVRMAWGEEADLPPGSDGAVIRNDRIAVTYLSRLVAERRSDLSATEAALDKLVEPSTVDRGTAARLGRGSRTRREVRHERHGVAEVGGLARVAVVHLEPAGVDERDDSASRRSTRPERLPPVIREIERYTPVSVPSSEASEPSPSSPNRTANVPSGDTEAESVPVHP